MFKLIDKVKLIIECEGISGLFWRGRRFLLPSTTNSKIFRQYKYLFEHRLALEIGGPSPAFRHNNIFPIYEVLAGVDGCNFSANTVWEGQIIAGLGNYKYAESLTGLQYINEGSDLSTIPNEHFDMVLSCHSLEHIANPLKALKEWMRVLKHEGHILLILPHPDYTFDHKRPITKFEHFLEDYQNGIDETDTECIEEVLTFHDMKRDPLGPSILAELKERSLENYENRCLHHHVFNVDLIKEMFKFAEIKFIESEFVSPCNIITIGQKI